MPERGSLGKLLELVVNRTVITLVEEFISWSSISSIEPDISNRIGSLSDGPSYIYYDKEFLNCNFIENKDLIIYRHVIVVWDRVQIHNC